MRIGRAIKVFGVFLCTACLTGQTPGIAPPAPVNVAPATSVTGIFNWIHSTADLDRGYAFYHGVFGIEMVNAPFGAIPGAPPPNTIRARAQAISDPIVGNLTDTGNARFRNLFMRLPGAEFGLELSEFNDIEARTVRPNLWDPGATTLILEVRDIDSAFAAIRKAGAPVVTLSAAPVKIGRGVRSVFIRDPDGYLIQVIQASPEAIAKTPVGSTVVGAAIGLTVADMAKERAFYQNILGFDISGGSRRGGDKEMLALIGLRKGRMNRSDANIPGTRARGVLRIPKGQRPAAPAAHSRSRCSTTATGRARSGPVDAAGERGRRDVCKRGRETDSAGVWPFYICVGPEWRAGGVCASGRTLGMTSPKGLRLMRMHARHAQLVDSIAFEVEFD